MTVSKVRLRLLANADHRWCRLLLLLGPLYYTVYPPAYEVDQEPPHTNTLMNANVRTWPFVDIANGEPKLVCAPPTWRSASGVWMFCLAVV